jgi:hypothetical protein
LAVFGEINTIKMGKKTKPFGDKSHAIGMTKVYLCCSTSIIALKTFNRFIVLFFFVLFSMFATAQQQKFSGWAMTVNTISLSPKFNFIFDSQLRSNDQWKKAETFILRPGLTYVLNTNVSLSAGLALITNWKTVEGIRDGVSDNRIWQQLGINKQVKNAVLQHRIRMEERWIPLLKIAGSEIVKSDPNFNARFRYFTRWISPFSKTKKLTKGIYWAVQNEFFFNVAGARHANRKLFDQSRTYAGTGYRLGKHADLELGYMFFYTEGRNKDYTTNNIIQLSSFLRL